MNLWFGLWKAPGGGWYEERSPYGGADACGHLLYVLYAVKVVVQRECAVGVVFTNSMPCVWEVFWQLRSLQKRPCGGGSLSQEW